MKWLLFKNTQRTSRTFQQRMKDGVLFCKSPFIRVKCHCLAARQSTYVFWKASLYIYSYNTVACDDFFYVPFSVSINWTLKAVLFHDMRSLKGRSSLPLTSCACFFLWWCDLSNKILAKNIVCKPCLRYVTSASTITGEWNPRMVLLRRLLSYLQKKRSP